jgi:hypothetical protein
MNELLHLLAQIEPRRPLNDDEPDGYLESDIDWVRNNLTKLVAIMEMAPALTGKDGSAAS